MTYKYVRAKKDVNCRRIGGIERLHTEGKLYKILVQRMENLTPAGRKQRIHITIETDLENGEHELKTDSKYFKENFEIAQ